MAYRDAFSAIVEARHAGEPGQAAAGVSVRHRMTLARSVELESADEEAGKTRDADKD
jgi:hypothetical protein